MGNYKISNKAVVDLDGIWDYTLREWSEEQAVKYYNQIYKTIQNLSNIPVYLIQKYDSVKPGLLGYRIGHHIIFYKQHKDGTVWVSRILHERMNFSRHLT